MIVTQLLNDF